MPASASDWTRYKRLVGAGRAGRAIDVVGNTDMENFQTPGSCAPSVCSSRAGVRRDQDRVVGLGRTRREASKWTDYVASQRADFITVSQYSGVFGSFGRRLTQVRVCGDGVVCPPSSTLQPKVGIRTSAVYQRSRIV
jgi:hypothetical protein